MSLEFPSGVSIMAGDNGFVCVRQSSRHGPPVYVTLSRSEAHAFARFIDALPPNREGAPEPCGVFTPTEPKKDEHGYYA